MAQQQSQPDADEAATAGDAATTADGDDASAAGAAAADSGAPAGDAGAAAEGQQAEGAEGEGKQPEPTEEEKAKAAEAEATLKLAAEKYAKEQIAQANRTMAAARRAERAAKEAAAQVANENTALKRENEVLGGFVDQLRKEPMAALQRLGFATFRDFATFVSENGGDAKAPTDEERIAALLDKKLEERDAPRRKAEQERAVEESKKAVFAYVDSLPDRFDLVTTDVGHDKLWKGILAYHEKHGVVPDEAVELIADEVEKALAASLSKTKRFGQRQPANNGASATGTAASGASGSGKTLAGKPTSGAPAARKYSTDPDERERQLNEELRRDGLL